MQNKFEFFFSGESLDGKDYGCKMIINGSDLDAIGKLLGQYVLAETQQGKHEPIRILIACFSEMEKSKGRESGKILKPSFKN